MNKLTTFLIIAQNGLGTAAGLLETEARKAEAKGDNKKAASNRKLASVLKAANDGISSYLQNS